MDAKIHPTIVTANMLLHLLKVVGANIAVNVKVLQNPPLNVITTTEGMFIQKNGTNQSHELPVP